MLPVIAPCSKISRIAQRRRKKDKPLFEMYIPCVLRERSKRTYGYGYYCLPFKATLERLFAANQPREGGETQ